MPAAGEGRVCVWVVRGVCVCGRCRHVHDVARAFEAVLHRGVIGEVYNIGTTKEKTVMEVAHTICRFFGLNPDDCIEQVPDRAFNDQRYFLETSKIAELGWVEQVQWEQGIKTTIEWFLAHGETWFSQDIRWVSFGSLGATVRDCRTDVSHTASTIAADRTRSY
jgi:hypothetical protein